MAATEPRTRDVVVALPVARADSAAHLGLRVETVSRTFAGFSREGMIPQRGPHRLRAPRARRLACSAGGEA